MEYTIANYLKSELPKVGDTVKIGEFTFNIEEGLECNRYYLNGIGCENDAAFCYVKENKYSFAKKWLKDMAQHLILEYVHTLVLWLVWQD